MPQICNPIAREIYETKRVLDDKGRPHEFDSGIIPESFEALYRTVRKYRPRQVLEVGMAQGMSTLAILTALSEHGGDAKLTSVDPNQDGSWHNVGRANVRRAGFEHIHQVIQKPDFLALPELLAGGHTFGLVYIDGWHTFDYAMLDFFYADKMLPVGGVVGFDDCSWPALRKVVRFVRTHRKYTEIDVGLDGYRGRNALFTLARRMLDDYRANRYYVKTEAWEGNYDFFKDF